MISEKKRAAIEALCIAEGMQFAPWETTPWEVDQGPCPYHYDSVGYKSWGPAQKLQKKLLARVEERDADPPMLN